MLFFTEECIFSSPSLNNYPKEIHIKEIDDVFKIYERKSAVRIGFPYGSTDTVIKTANNTYILFTTNAASIMSQIVSLITN
ncbi:hypothetical protein QNK06_11635 [Bacillus subtilis]|uniref:SunI/YnzG family protein n=1 Tax=Bacillus subtilis TaxID=1423 RepID=UPI0021A90F9F|nr:hypothetical protein [Bacillus subtilis]UWS59378.1 hypothetical protein N1207_11865 [Bacillus subtilis]WBU36558.1 hypothetical protein OSK17_11790 [Bacillus subtilis]WHY11626.1 hypothetical protein QNK06_11635 [Bacillus subtilis]WPP27688.1 hypothetical protein SIS06_11955 [Bacillus subtilis]